MEIASGSHGIEFGIARQRACDRERVIDVRAAVDALAALLAMFERRELRRGEDFRDPACFSTFEDVLAALRGEGC